MRHSRRRKSKVQPGGGWRENLNARWQNATNMATEALNKGTSSFRSKESTNGEKVVRSMQPGHGGNIPTSAAEANAKSLPMDKVTATAFNNAADYKENIHNNKIKHDVTHNDKSTSGGLVTQVPQGIPTPGSANNADISTAFGYIYKILAVVSLFIIVILFFLSLVDVLKYFFTELKQTAKVVNSVDIFYKDTSDVTALSYTRGDLEEEPYTIFAQQKILSVLFIILGTAVILFALHLTTFVSMKIYAVVTEKEYIDSLNVPLTALFAIVYIGVIALTVRGNYKKKFVNNVRKDLRTLASDLRQIKTFIYDNMTTNKTFLQSLVNEDTASVVTQIRNHLQRSEADLCAATPGKPDVYCDKEVEKMMFSWNLYTYLKDSVPMTDPQFKKINYMFNNVERQDIDPAEFFYYRKSLYVPNTWATISNEFVNVRYQLKPGSTQYTPVPLTKAPVEDEEEEEDEDTATLPTPSTYVEQAALIDFFLQPIYDGKSEVSQKRVEARQKREQAFMSSLNSTMASLNKLLVRMYDMPRGKKQVRSYLISTFVLFIVFFTIVPVLIYFLYPAAFAIMIRVKSLMEGKKVPPS
jgi:hypothetical protein